MSLTTQEKVNNYREAEFTESRFTLRSIVYDFFYNLIHLERKKYFYTAWDLTTAPGTSIHKYISGYRQYLYQPGEYLFLTGAIILFLTIRYTFFANEFSENISDNPLLAVNKDFFMAFFTYAEEYATIVNIVAIPVFTLLSWLFYRNTKHNFAENLIMNTYITAQQLLFLVLLVPLLELFPYTKQELIGFYSIGVIVYNIWVYVDFFEERIVTKLIKAIAINVIAFPLQFVANVSFYYVFEPVLKYLPQF